MIHGSNLKKEVNSRTIILCLVYTLGLINDYIISANWIPIIWLHFHSVCRVRVTEVLPTWESFKYRGYLKSNKVIAAPMNLRNSKILKCHRSPVPVFDVSKRTDYRTWCIYQDRVCFYKSSLPCSADWSSTVLMSVADVNNSLNIFRFSALFKFGLFRSPQLQSVTIINNQSQGPKTRSTVL